MSDNYICKECGAVMYMADDEVAVCPKCGYSMDIEDYSTDNDYEEYYSPMDSILEEPECCKACGGPYPSCTTSCKIFDE